MKTKNLSENIVKYYINDFSYKNIEDILNDRLFDNLSVIQKKVLLKLFQEELIL